ncbi:MAG: CgeB family protein [Burkholderiales bacterium]
MTIVFLGLSITSSWGNGHATTYRALIRALASRGHDVLFLERDAPWYADNRDLPEPPYCRTRLYTSVAELERTYAGEIGAADVVIVGSYVPEGTAVADMVLRIAAECTAFYDIDTPVTLRALRHDQADYISRAQVPRFDLYLSFTGGPTLARLEQEFGAQRARALHCAVDADMYFEDTSSTRDMDLGYLGTYSIDRQPTLDALLLQPARTWAAGRFVVAGPQYPQSLEWPANVERVIHLAPAVHQPFYNRLRFTLNVTRRDMVEAGYSPSVRLFEAAACGTPIISDDWPGLEAYLAPGQEILVARSSRDVMACLRELPEADREAIGRKARDRVLASHTAEHRAFELERYVNEATRRERVPDAEVPTTAGARTAGIERVRPRLIAART